MTQGNLVGGNVAISDGLVTITSGGNTISVTAPGIENIGIDPNGTGYHIYSGQHLVGPVGYFNGPNGLWNNLLEEPAPTLGLTSSNTPVAQGQYGYAPGLGVVQHFYNPSGMTVINVTASGHMLCAGVVTRTLEVVNGNYVVTTKGVGNGILPGPNDWLSNWAWGANVGRLARETIYEEANGVAFPPPECFPAHTHISISSTETRPISDIRIGDTVLAFDHAADLGPGALVPRKVVRLYRNTTEEWIKLTWLEGGEAKELVATPGHHFLDCFGKFPTIAEMLENGKATVVLSSGELTEVTAERIIFNAETAHLFEQAQAVGMVAGNAVLKPAAIDAWQTYNFEVEDLHTYVAGGVRVHNKSGFFRRVSNRIGYSNAASLGMDREFRNRANEKEYERANTPKKSYWKAWYACFAAVFFVSAIIATPVYADDRRYFEEWSQSEGFDVGYACNWWKDVPGPESMFQVSKLNSAEILADVGAIEFRMIKPTSANRTVVSYDGSLFTVRVDREAGSVVVIRVTYASTRNGSCGFILKATDNSTIEVLRGSGVPNAVVSRNAIRWVEKNIADCHRRLRQAIDPNLLFDCVGSLDPYSTDPQPSEGLRESVMPEGVVPASVARIFIQNRGKAFAVTTFGETLEITAVGE